MFDMVPHDLNNPLVNNLLKTKTGLSPVKLIFFKPISLSKLPENLELLSKGMNGCPERRQ